MAKERDARYPNVVSLARELANHGTERGRRTLTVIEAISAGRRERAAAARASDPSPTPSGSGLDTGTLSAAATERAPSSSMGTRRSSGPRFGLLVVALGAIAGTIFFVQRLRAPDHNARGAATTDAAVMPPEKQAEPPAPPIASV